MSSEDLTLSVKYYWKVSS